MTSIPDPHINIHHKYSNIFLNTITQQPGVESHHGQAGKLEKNESLKCWWKAKWQACAIHLLELDTTSVLKPLLQLLQLNTTLLLKYITFHNSELIISQSFCLASSKSSIQFVRCQCLQKVSRSCWTNSWHLNDCELMSGAAVLWLDSF